MKSVNEINTAIISSGFSNSELDAIADALRYARSQLSKNIKRKLSIGDNVNFTSSRNGRNYTGHVVKVAIKYVTVRTVDGLWKVPANMLTVVESASARS